MPHKDPAIRREYQRRYKKTTTKRLSDKLYSAARRANERAAHYGAPGRVRPADLRPLFADAACHYCGARGRTMSVDHVVALAKGGANDMSNIVVACMSCNARKRRAERLGKWSDDHDRCVTCGTTDHEHTAYGRCTSCWPKEYAVLRRQPEWTGRAFPRSHPQPVERDRR